MLQSLNQVIKTNKSTKKIEVKNLLYLHFMENRLREKYGFTGTPIKTTITKERRSHTTYNY